MTAGRPSSYTQEIGAEICRRLTEGESLRSICRDDHIPALSTVLLWVVDGKHSQFSEQYVQAREAQGYYYADEIGRVISDVEEERIDPNRAKVVIDGLKWVSERMARKHYGTKQAHEITGKDGGPIQTEDMSNNELGRRIAFALQQAARTED